MEEKSPAMGEESLKSRVDEYIAQCSAAGVFPDLPGMRLFLGLSRRELEKLREDKGCRAVLDYAADCRESWLLRKMCEDNKLSTACMNALRQAENGGYGEKQAEGRGLEIKFSGNIGREDFL